MINIEFSKLTHPIVMYLHIDLKNKKNFKGTSRVPQFGLKFSFRDGAAPPSDSEIFAAGLRGYGPFSIQCTRSHNSYQRNSFERLNG